MSILNIKKNTAFSVTF